MSEGGNEAFVVGLGMVAALGADVITNCAAARAGISRSAPIEHYRARSAVEGDAELVNGYQASLFTRGFEGETRLVRLAQGALADLLIQSRDIGWRQYRHQFYLSLPDTQRVQTGRDLIADDDARRGRTEAEAEWHQDGEPADDRSSALRATRIAQKAAALARWPVEASAVFASSNGHAGGLEAIRAAVADLASGVTEIAIVLGVDSWLDEETLKWLNLCGRLKCDGTPAGLSPGEAGVAVALTTRRDLSTARAPTARLRDVFVASEKRTLLSAASAAGEGLASVVAQAWDHSDAGVPWVICDQNGEMYRATDWGHAIVRLRAQFDAFADPVIWYPALSFGDTGAASALTGVCLAVRAWERGYAPAAAAVIAAASDGESRAAAIVANNYTR